MVVGGGSCFLQVMGLNLNQYCVKVVELFLAVAEKPTYILSPQQELQE